ncbi:MAG: RNA polymerase sigma factor region1.1 domain-containing protein [Bacillota bacterium]
MLSSERALERCVHFLISRGRSYGGYVTYRMIGDVLRSTRSEMSMENLDCVYDRLVAEGVQIVDRLPESAAIRVAAHADEADAGEPLSGYPGLSRGPRGRRLATRDDDRSDTVDWCEPALCPEEAIDELLLLAEAGLLCSGIFWSAAEKCRLSRSEARQLAEYLWSKGVDIAGLDYLEFYQRFLARDDFADTGHDDRFPDDGVWEYNRGESRSRWD